MQYATAIYAHSNYELVIVGHSLGEGVAILLALRCGREFPCLFSRQVLQAISYASPCVLCVCNDISQAPFPRNHVTCVVVMGNDVVSRLGLATFRELQRQLVAIAGTIMNIMRIIVVVNMEMRISTWTTIVIWMRHMKLRSMSLKRI
jgi:hypothetical protein